MHKEDKLIIVELDPNISTFIKHGFNNRVRWPLLNIGVVLINKTTSVNEEWLRSIEHMPTRKILYKYTSKILRNEVSFCAYLNKKQTPDKKYITLYDFDFYIIHKDNTFEMIDKPNELKETLLHTYQDYRLKNLQDIELIAFSSGININDEIKHQLSTILDIENFNREYDNIKPILKTTFESIVPCIVTAPLGILTIRIETYSWIDNKNHIKEILQFLEGYLVSDIHSHKLETSDINDNNAVSVYNPSSGLIFVNDLVTMCIINFFGCDSRLNTYHIFDINNIDTSKFLNAISDAFKKIMENI
ncbi:DNA-dependent RNA polymerase subunit RPO35 [Cotia virus SPAn232]|uniref:DNA-directed RNA polymerase 35 kDa subunit n=2 Tax=Cotia virus TaxID=39444 RepID=H6TAA6_9POXV|nr:DNA-dependent RNA polymerase subunit RPO35 [Cotia virus SPAn232]ADT91146.1 DNA-dependent RNA polymerase subunit RPO35 [Cotia virus SPAn232]AIT70751.1 DNA-dependent RNA polymerase subunit RPO35 [Cotia virus]